MKKRLCSILSLVFALSLCACGGTENEGNNQSSTQQHPNCYFEYATYGVEIGQTSETKMKGILDSDTVSYSTSDENIVTVNEKGELTGVADGTAEITATVKNASGTTVQTVSCSVEINDGIYETLDGEETFVKWEGRNFTYNNAVNCFNTASGFEVKFYGTQFKVTALANGGTTRLSVLVDKDTDPRENLVVLTNSSTTSQEYTLVEGLEEGYHTIRVYKTSAATTSSLAFVSMQTDGYFWAQPKEKDLKIEVYGDSITVGACNMRTTTQDGDNDKDNGCYTYAWLAAQEVGADINVIARSGIGMIYSWGSEYFMTDAYKQTYCSESDRFGYQYNPDWDFSSYIPDVVVINVGTNDLGRWDEDTYVVALTGMCEDLIDKYGDDVQFLFCYGMMGSGFKEGMETVAENIPNSTLLKLPMTKTGAHPWASEHAEAAIVLAEALEEYI